MNVAGRRVPHGMEKKAQRVSGNLRLAPPNTKPQNLKLAWTSGKNFLVSKSSNAANRPVVAMLLNRAGTLVRGDAGRRQQPTMPRAFTKLCARSTNSEASSRRHRTTADGHRCPRDPERRSAFPGLLVIQPQAIARFLNRPISRLRSAARTAWAMSAYARRTIRLPGFHPGPTADCR